MVIYNLLLIRQRLLIITKSRIHRNNIFISIQTLLTDTVVYRIGIHHTQRIFKHLDGFRIMSLTFIKRSIRTAYIQLHFPGMHRQTLRHTSGFFQIIGSTIFIYIRLLDEKQCMIIIVPRKIGSTPFQFRTIFLHNIQRFSGIQQRRISHFRTVSVKSITSCSHRIP